MQRPYIPACTCPYCRVELTFRNYSDMGHSWLADSRWKCGNCHNDVTDALHGRKTKPEPAELLREEQVTP